MRIKINDFIDSRIVGSLVVVSSLVVNEMPLRSVTKTENQDLLLVKPDDLLLSSSIGLRICINSDHVIRDYRVSFYIFILKVPNR